MKHNSFKRVAAGAMAALLIGMGMPTLCTGTQDTMLTAFADEQHGIEQNDTIIEAGRGASIGHIDGSGTVQYYYLDENGVKHIGGHPPIGATVYVEVTPDANYIVKSVDVRMENRQGNIDKHAVKGENSVYSFTMYDSSVIFEIFIYYEKGTGENSVVNPDNPDNPVSDRFAVSPEGAGTFSIGGSSVTANANLGWKFVSWTQDDGLTSKVLSDSIILILNDLPYNDQRITANFSKISYPVSLDSSNAHCKITRKSGKNMKDFADFTTTWGSTVTFAVTPDENYAVKSVKVRGDVITPDADGMYSFTVPKGGAVITVETEEHIMHPLNFDESIENGYVFADVNSAGAGESVTLNVVPNAGYVTAGVQVNGDEIQPVDGLYTFTMPDEDVTVFVQFKKNSEDDPHTSVTTAPSDPDVPLVIAPNPFESDDPLDIAPNAYYADIDELCRMAQVDYEKKHSAAPANADAVENEDGTFTITLTDKDNKVLDVYTIDSATAVGHNQTGKEVNLPQTGNFAKGTAVCTAAAVLAIIAGAFTALKSGVRKKKADEE